ncbi:hypothetical protein AJ78_04633 [Emergomyces pasteurianus Ep9510]|uniref:Uncharacterized protein n=1 Tax=Emergomyces pasteurianus Ep9510 TaxID=1447872 RepID=A0A1J9PGH3_9EURO|nr:hypothetical protein AJ78_04633 [Emergomyces pasteurianus Ep9510]
MPSVNIPETSPITPRVNHPRLKTHKALPRKRDIFLTQGLTSVPSSPSSRLDPTPPSNGFTYPAAPALPLTPPGLALEACKKSSNGITREVSHELIPGTTGTATPTHQLSPPTPDITPPRVVSQFRRREGLTSIQPSMSSRAESFTTAREALSSEEEELERRSARVTPLLRPTKHKLPHPLRTNTSTGEPGEPGLSIKTGPPGDESLTDGRSLNQTDANTFDSFDGQWAKPQENNIAIFQKKKHRYQPILSDHDPVSQVSNSRCDSHPVSKSSSSRQTSLEQRLQKPKNIPITSSIEKFAEDIGWISGEAQLDMSERIHVWRLSGISTTSTVEAVVIDSPPRKLPTLRHTEKNSSLRSVSSPLPKPCHDDSTLSLNDPHHRLIRKSARITNENRWSVSSDMSFAASVSSTRPIPKHDVVPVVVIPQRRSSLKSTHSDSRVHSRAHSLGSSRRPTTAPDDAISSFDVSRRTRRTLSASLPSTTSKDVGRRSYISGPAIPQRRSSLSAPTSRNNSRAPSFTSESFRHHELPPAVQPITPQGRNQGNMDPIHTKSPVPEPVKQFANPTPCTSEQPVDENGPMISPSLPLTPFQASIQSLSPGPVEIHEARAVPFFLHNNKSLLLVDQQPIPESRAVQELRTSPGDMEMKIARPQTPNMSTTTAKADMDSPLRNPRAPPKPPAVKIIPPTPMDEINQPAVPESNTLNKNDIGIRRLGSVRRALSSRRRTETYPTEVLSHNVRNPKAGKNIDSKLHPFWLPRPFWEGLADSDVEGEGYLRSGSPIARGIDDLYVGNSLGIPQKRVIFTGPMSVIRRLSNRSRYRTAHLKNRKQELPSHYKTGFPSHRVHTARRNHNYTLPRRVLRIPIRSLRELQEWVIQIRRQREQYKLEERRDKLRKSIGRRVLTNNTAIIVPDGR